MPAEPGAVEGRKVVIDAGAAIKLQRLDKFGGDLFTTGGVYREVKDERARALLQALPVELRVREAVPQDIAFTKQFAKATGDLGFLSQNDVDLIALTVGLHRENGGTVRQRPAALETSQGQNAFEWAPGQGIAASKRSAEQEDSKELQEPAETAKPADAPSAPEAQGEEAAPSGGRKVCFEEEAAEVQAVVAPAAAPVELAAAETEAAQKTPTEPAAPAAPAASPATAATATPEADRPAAGEDEKQEEEDDAEDVDSEDGSSAGEWVTPENMQHFGIGVQPDSDVKVTCATSDYSVQNVLLQMGITPLTFDGYAVRTVKLWGLFCRACSHFTRDTQKVFCPKCGHDTVVRVPIIVDQDGKPQVMSTGRPLRRKGTVYSIPKVQGGRAWKPIFAADEVMIGGRDRQLRHQQKLAEKDRMSRDPFNEDNGARAWYQRNTTSTGKALVGGEVRVQAGYGRRVNPNANNFKFSNGRKRR